ncbi:MAG: GNAT family N-acetyltransferase [Candidatus Nanopelagicales bacterium]|nr:GNAT family N-acetyltransferase [Candidatus Nanopelagicales bacterium]
MAVIVREMRAADVPAALDLLEEVAAEEVWLGTEPGFDRHRRGQYWLEGLADPTVSTLVVLDAAPGRLVGQGTVHVARYGVAELGMNLAADVRGRGLGGQLLDALLDAARARGAHKAELQVWPHNAPAVRLYLSRGFVVEGRIRAHYRRASGQLWDAILMGLALDPDLLDAAHGSGLPDAPGLPGAIRIADA